LAAFWVFNQYTESLARVSDARDTLTQIQALLTAAITAETTQRGYLLTNKASYLEPFSGSISTLEDNLNKLRPKLERDGNDPGAIAELQASVENKVAELRDTIRIAQQQSPQAALKIVESDRGQRAMSKIREIVALIENHESALLQGHRESLRKVRIEVAALFGSGVVLSLLLVFLVHRANQKFAQERDRRESELAVANTELDHRVRHRTLDLEIRTLELEERTQELQRSNADLESFAYVASHDLQEPLRMISNFAALLSRRYHNRLNQEADEFIGIMVESARHMQNLIDDLLHYSRAGTRPPEREEVPLRELAEAALHHLSTVISETGAVIEIESLPVVSVDKVLLTQVFQNLLSNAIKFGRPGVSPTICITASETIQLHRWTISVTDNGIGFDSDYADVIFRMFQTLHSKQSYPGTGIGLAICKRIIEQHGGTIWAKSTPGSGSTFSFTVPAIRRASTSLTAAS
jgi:signal transduction histidine kinase